MNRMAVDSLTKGRKPDDPHRTCVAYSRQMFHTEPAWLIAVR